ncbi:hypothetical protein AMAG_08838 [Allomyces macrogynus ATCC 38327]|uniref:Uncharacterized protein n=1 Tax=Allomyces macrogynus (strain ATCC 38327) TaxID=578462 RepID=A0A0L0SMZ5_ALLM3|nr:hypothetical protein AMAG_08838 [Allomyces macrogynus ATCC 38327]|eukprot:KNE63755.1 hypothetical protein AMAG_08838 [Allomyces macrogynus ATCC 38327]
MASSHTARSNGRHAAPSRQPSARDVAPPRPATKRKTPSPPPKAAVNRLVPEADRSWAAFRDDVVFQDRTMHGVYGMATGTSAIRHDLIDEHVLTDLAAVFHDFDWDLSDRSDSRRLRSMLHDWLRKYDQRLCLDQCKSVLETYWEHIDQGSSQDELANAIAPLDGGASFAFVTVLDRYLVVGVVGDIHVTIGYLDAHGKRYLHPTRIHPTPLDLDWLECGGGEVALGTEAVAAVNQRVVKTPHVRALDADIATGAKIKEAVAKKHLVSGSAATKPSTSTGGALRRSGDSGNGASAASSTASLVIPPAADGSAPLQVRRASYALAALESNPRSALAETGAIGTEAAVNRHDRFVHDPDMLTGLPSLGAIPAPLRQILAARPVTHPGGLMGGFFYKISPNLFPLAPKIEIVPLDLKLDWGITMYPSPGAIRGLFLPHDDVLSVQEDGMPRARRRAEDRITPIPRGLPTDRDVSAVTLAKLKRNTMVDIARDVCVKCNLPGALVMRVYGVVAVDQQPKRSRLVID